MKHLYLFLVGILSIHKIETKGYEGYKVYEIIPETYDDANILQTFREKSNFDFWEESRSIGDATDIMVAPEVQRNFERELTRNNINFKIVVDNVERLLQQERVQQRLTRSSVRLGSVTFSSYMFYNEQMAYLRRLAIDYPNTVTIQKIGESYEGRDLLLLRLSSGPSQTGSPKPIIFIDAGIHCREWIAHPTALYIIQQLVENSDNAAMFQNIDWAIIPNLNPDGFEYTQTNDRLWRKNRRLAPGNPCYGTDLNRNFGYYWMFSGASNNSCTEIYAGESAFSEPESRAIRDWFNENGENVKLYLSIHSFGEYMLYPWGYNASLPDDHEELQYLGELAGNAIGNASTINSEYTVNTSTLALGVGAGGSDDWVKGVVGVELAYTVELPNKDAPYFFMLPARLILPVVQETFEGIRAFHRYIEDKFWNNIIP